RDDEREALINPQSISNHQSAISNQQLKRGPRWPPFFAGEVGCLPFLAGLLLPAFGFLRHCLLSPPSCGINCAGAHAHRPWLPPGTLTGCAALVASRHLPEACGRVSSERLPPSFTRDGRELTILIPDVDSKRDIRSVKHKSTEKVKNFARMQSRCGSIRDRCT